MNDTNDRFGTYGKTTRPFERMGSYVDSLLDPVG